MNEPINENQKILHLVVPAKAEYLSLVRLVVAAVASKIGLAADSVADIKVAISEASSNAIRHAYPDDHPDELRVIEVDCFDDSGSLVMRITDHGGGMPIPPPPSEGLGFGIMGSLMDKVDVETDEEGTSVMMRKVSLSVKR